MISDVYALEFLSRDFWTIMHVVLYVLLGVLGIMGVLFHDDLFPEPREKAARSSSMGRLLDEIEWEWPSDV